MTAGSAGCLSYPIRFVGLMIMRLTRESAILCFLLLFGLAVPGFSQALTEDIKNKVDALILEAYQSASAEFPCKLKNSGEHKILRWRDVEKCLNNAEGQIDWEGLARKMQALPGGGKYYATDLLSVIESSLAAHTLPFDKVFQAKEAEALLPLSNSLLKFLPADSLLELPVYDKAGKRIGTFAGVYTYEKMGEISGARMRHALFQYTDATGRMQSSPDRLLLDSYSVPWKDAKSQPGFRLTVDKLLPKH
jgi:hypothetical protein